MDPSRATYDKTGTLVCPSCAARVQIAEGDSRAVSSTVSTAIAVGICGLLSWTCMNFYFILSIITVVTGVSWLVMIARNEPLRRKMGGKFVPCMIAACVGLALGGAPLAFLALGLSALGLGALLGH
jgi:hypothetical protein